MRSIDAITGAVRVVQAVAIQHRDVWPDEPVSFWLRRLNSELAEAGDSLDGKHDDPLEWEALQVAAIAVGLLASMLDAGVELPAPEELLERHRAKAALKECQ